METTRPSPILVLPTERHLPTMVGGTTAASGATSLATLDGRLARLQRLGRLHLRNRECKAEPSQPDCTPYTEHILLRNEPGNNATA